MPKHDMLVTTELHGKQYIAPLLSLPQLPWHARHMQGHQCYQDSLSVFAGLYGQVKLPCLLQKCCCSGLHSGQATQWVRNCSAPAAACEPTNRKACCSCCCSCLPWPPVLQHGASLHCCQAHQAADVVYLQAQKEAPTLYLFAVAAWHTSTCRAWQPTDAVLRACIPALAAYCWPCILLRSIAML